MGNIISIIRGEGSPYYGDYNDMVYPNLVGKNVEYEYDPNGNLIKNSDNRISLTTYNLLNLPQTVAFSDKSLSVFYYMADGRKIRNATGAYSISTAVPIDSVVKNTDPYISYMSEWNDVYWYQKTQQKYINTPEGNIEVSTGRKMSFSYCYTSKDHLGSIWLYWNSLSNKYSNIYYPSGIMREKRRSPFNYGLTGKEIVYDNGLDEYFFGARTLFAPINRFNQPDPLCEEYYHISPYAYCANNPVKYVDQRGDSVRVYTETNAAGHTWISVGEGNNMIVYSYGRYNGTNKGPNGSLNTLSNGDGILLRLTGEEAKAYNEKKAANEMSVFVITDIADEKVANILDEKFNSSVIMPSNPKSRYYNNPSAHVIDEYKLTTNNCTTVVSDVLNNSGSNALKRIKYQQTSNFGTSIPIPITDRFVLPISIQNYLTKISKPGGVVYKTR